MTNSGARAGLMEAAGQGSFEIKGKTIVFRNLHGYEWKWPCKTEAEAKRQLKLFRASAKYLQPLPSESGIARLVKLAG